jgi:hypothetical protein
MTQNWHLIYSTGNSALANILKGMLEENHIPAIIMNKQDSSYLSFGDIEIYVPRNLKDIAAQLIDKALLN